jgi:hypothetical protein
MHLIEAPLAQFLAWSYYPQDTICPEGLRQTVKV